VILPYSGTVFNPRCFICLFGTVGVACIFDFDCLFIVHMHKLTVNGILGAEKCGSPTAKIRSRITELKLQLNELRNTEIAAPVDVLTLEDEEKYLGGKIAELQQSCQGLSLTAGEVNQHSKRSGSRPEEHRKPHSLCSSETGTVPKPAGRNRQ
jgi:hypothetical protein